jgi:hypothetical protein
MLKTNFQSQPHPRPGGPQIFDARWDELSLTVQKMDSDGILQTNYKIINTTVNSEFTHVLAELYYPEKQ